MNFSLETRYWFLRDHQLFHNLDATELRTICMISNFKSAHKGEIIYFNHDENGRVYFLKKGIIKIVDIDSHGNETIKEILHKGDLFGQITLEDAEINEYAVVLSDQVTCCSFKIDDFEKVIQNNPTLALKFTKLVGVRFKRLENRYSNLMFKDVRTRLLLFLKEWAEREGHNSNGKIILKNYLTHQDMASLVCSTRQTVSQLMNELKDSGFIEYSRSAIVITNLSIFKKIAA